MFVQAYDMGSPSKTSATNATVTISVYRNLQTPTFTGGPFNANIPETTVTGTSILQVNFGDTDTDVRIPNYQYHIKPSDYSSFRFDFGII
jgi:hypothetical protein